MTTREIRFNLERALLAAACSIALFGCGGGGEAGDHTPSTNAEGSSPASGAESTTSEDSDADTSQHPNDTPKNEETPNTPQPSTDTPNDDEAPNTDGYVKLADVPIGAIADIQSVLMTASSKYTNKFPPTPILVIDRITNPVAGDLSFGLTSKSSDKGGYLKQISTATKNMNWWNIDEAVLTVTNWPQKIAGVSYDISSGSKNRQAMTVASLSEGNGYVGFGKWEYTGETNGYYDVISGGFAFGSETRKADLPHIHSGSYIGLIVGNLRYQEDWLSSPSYPIAAGVSKGTIDIDARKISIQVPKLSKTFTSTGWDDIESKAGEPMLACESDVNLAENAFSCDLKSVDTGQTRGKLSGKFYGPGGREVGGVLNYYDNWANNVTAGFMLKLQ